MKKLLITAGILLLAAVFMSGCITAPASDDPVVGIWEMPIPGEEIFTSETLVINADGTGYSLGRLADTPVSGKLDFTWKNLGDNKYALTMTDTKGLEIPAARELVLAGDVLTTVITPEFSLDYHRITLDEYAPGLWTGIRGDYNEYTDIQVLFYLGADGKGNTVVYGPNVLNLDEVFTAEFTWKAEGDKVVITGEQGLNIDLPVVNGELIFSGLYPLHKYTIPDHLYGLWESAELYVENGVSYDIVEVIKSDGTGVEIWTVPGSDKASFRYTFTWEMIDATTYEAVYDDGDVWLFETVNAQLYDGETTYNKVGFDVLQEYAQSKVNA